MDYDCDTINDTELQNLAKSLAHMCHVINVEFVRIDVTLRVDVLQIQKDLKYQHIIGPSTSELLEPQDNQPLENPQRHQGDTRTSYSLENAIAEARKHLLAGETQIDFDEIIRDNTETTVIDRLKGAKKLDKMLLATLAGDLVKLHDRLVKLDEELKG